MKELNKEIQEMQPMNIGKEFLDNQLEDDGFENLNINALIKEQKIEDLNNSGKKLTLDKYNELKKLGMPEKEIDALPNWTDTQAEAYGDYQYRKAPAQEEIDAYVALKMKQQGLKTITDQQRNKIVQHFKDKKFKNFIFTNKVNNYLMKNGTKTKAKNLNFEGLSTREVNDDFVEYNSVYKEKTFGWGKSREQKIKNPKSRLYGKDQIAKQLESLEIEEIPQEQMEKYNEVTENAETKEQMEKNIPVLGDITKELLSIDYSEINFSSMADIVNNASMFEKHARFAEIAEKAYNANPGFLVSLKEKEAMVKNSLSLVRAATAYYRVKKLIYTNPYYRTHYNEEISMNAKADDSPDKQQLSKLLRMSYYLAKNLDKARGDITGTDPMLVNKGELDVSRANEYTKNMEAEVCLISYKESDYANCPDPEFQEAKQKLDEAYLQKQGKNVALESKRFILNAYSSFYEPEELDKIIAVANDINKFAEADAKMQERVSTYKKHLANYQAISMYLFELTDNEKIKDDGKTNLTPEQVEKMQVLKNLRSTYESDYNTALSNYQDVLKSRFEGSFEERRDRLIEKLEKEAKGINDDGE